MMKRFLALLLALLMAAPAALADWTGTAEALADQFIAAGYPLGSLVVESETLVTFEGGAIEVFPSVEDCDAARTALFYGETAGFRRDNVLLTRTGPEVTSQHSEALQAVLAGDSMPSYDEERADRERSLRGMVWVPVHGGRKYHDDPDCSQMIDPWHVTLPMAVFLGYDACKRCY